MNGIVEDDGFADDVRGAETGIVEAGVLFREHDLVGLVYGSFR